MNKYACILLACLLAGSANAVGTGSLRLNVSERRLQDTEEDQTAATESAVDDATEAAVENATEISESTTDEPEGKRHAITLWWVIYNKPEFCTSSPSETPNCSDLDVTGPAFRESMAKGAPDLESLAANEEAQISILHGAGGITDPNGNLILSSSIYASPDSTMDIGSGLDPNLWGRGLLDSKNSEVHIVLRDHGPVDEEGFGDQISNYFEPFCDDLLFQVNGEFSDGNVCEDAQIVRFPTNFEGTIPMSWYEIGATEYETIEGTTVSLKRYGSALQTVVKTTFARS